MKLESLSTVAEGQLFKAYFSRFAAASFFLPQNPTRNRTEPLRRISQRLRRINLTATLKVRLRSSPQTESEQRCDPILTKCQDQAFVKEQPG